MNINVYLRDDLGARAKEAELPFSQLLRDAVSDELERREAMATTLDEPSTYEVEIEDRDGRFYTGRITGQEIARNDYKDTRVFLTDDERVIVYVGDNFDYWISEDPVEELRNWLEPGVYASALHALGEKPVIDL